MTVTEKLTLAKELIIQAEKIIADLYDPSNMDSSSLREYYGYSMEIMEHELNKISTNKNYRVTRATSLEEIIDAEGDKWFDESD